MSRLRVPIAGFSAVVLCLSVALSGVMQASADEVGASPTAPATESSAPEVQESTKAEPEATSVASTQSPTAVETTPASTTDSSVKAKQTAAQAASSAAPKSTASAKPSSQSTTAKALGGAATTAATSSSSSSSSSPTQSPVLDGSDAVQSGCTVTSAALTAVFVPGAWDPDVGGFANVTLTAHVALTGVVVSGPGGNVGPFDLSAGEVDNGVGTLSPPESRVSWNGGGFTADITGCLGKPSATEVTPTAPAQSGNVITIPDQDGVVYKDQDGNVLTSGTHTITKDTTITATAEDGYVFPDGATTEWSFTFTAPFDWNWQYMPPVCGVGLTVNYPGNIPSGSDHKDVNIKVKDLVSGTVKTFNFHDSNFKTSGKTVTYDVTQHADWLGWTWYEYQWTQVHGTNYHWEGSVVCGEKPPITKIETVKVTGEWSAYTPNCETEQWVKTREVKTYEVTYEKKNGKWVEVGRVLKDTKTETHKKAFGPGDKAKYCLVKVDVPTVTVEPQVCTVGDQGAGNFTNGSIAVTADDKVTVVVKDADEQTVSDLSSVAPGAYTVYASLSKNAKWSDLPSGWSFTNNSKTIKSTVTVEAAADCTVPVPETPEPSFGEWVDGTWQCGDTSVSQTRQRTDYTFVWNPQMNVFDEVAKVTSETRSRDLGDDEISLACQPDDELVTTEVGRTSGTWECGDTTTTDVVTYLTVETVYVLTWDGEHTTYNFRSVTIETYFVEAVTRDLTVEEQAAGCEVPPVKPTTPASPAPTTPASPEPTTPVTPGDSPTIQPGPLPDSPGRDSGDGLAKTGSDVGLWSLLLPAVFMAAGLGFITRRNKSAK